MARRVRLWFAGAKFHVTSRGIRKSSLFYEDEDYKKYLSYIEETKDRYPFQLHSYCLMTNHTHLQLETYDTPLSIIMKHLNTKYAKYFNQKYDFSGHVFDKRYGAEILDSREYEIDVSKYIHLNPVEARMVTAPEEYPWSSYRAYLYGESEETPLVNPNPILSYFPEPSQHYYQQYIHSLLTDKFFWKDGKIIKLEGEWFPCGLE
ncbi:transposase [Neobacillus sp. MM2021_6]|uniref:transposase n=1 Tax=Neobacillus sp. MM2021_6 TaxID=2817026 RepID=UPI001408B1DE|nr:MULTISPECIES: transposase [Bacillaceae]MBO0958648.1 transposase [Neobacillus sp. MM2021_6]NHC20212.1 transposase [Bacillus sp. MM2020_4]